MRKKAVMVMVSAFLVMTACGSQKRENQEGAFSNISSQSETSSEHINLETEETENAEETEQMTAVAYSCEKGSIRLEIPEDWDYQIHEYDEEMEAFSVAIHPAAETEGSIIIGYTEYFGVCGTGLRQEDYSLNGMPAEIGIYDDHTYWDFLVFLGDNEGYFIENNAGESWWSDYETEIQKIFATLSFGSSYSDSKAEELGVRLRVEDVTATGLTLVYEQQGGNPTGELFTGTEYSIEQYADSEWEKVSYVVDGNIAWEQLAYLIDQEGVTEQIVDWSWLYGELESGEYRIKKEISDFRAPGDYDTYEIYGYFQLD